MGRHRAHNDEASRVSTQMYSPRHAAPEDVDTIDDDSELDNGNVLFIDIPREFIDG